MIFVDMLIIAVLMDIMAVQSYYECFHEIFFVQVHFLIIVSILVYAHIIYRIHAQIHVIIEFLDTCRVQNNLLDLCRVHIDYMMRIRMVVVRFHVASNIVVHMMAVVT